MQKLVIFLAAALAAIPAVAQMKPQTGTPGAPRRLQRASQLPLDQARRISRNEAINLVSRGQAVFIDIRSKESFDNAHIKGAISLPQSKLGDRWASLPANKMLIPYCACHAEETAAMAVLYFNAHGIKNTAALTGGWIEWKNAGLPVEGIGVR